MIYRFRELRDAVTNALTADWTILTVAKELKYAGWLHLSLKSHEKPLTIGLFFVCVQCSSNFITGRIPCYTIRIIGLHLTQAYAYIWQAELAFSQFFQISGRVILDIRKPISDIWKIFWTFITLYNFSRYQFWISEISILDIRNILFDGFILDI